MSKELRLRIIFGLLYAAFIVILLLYGQIGASILLGIFGMLMLWEFNKISLCDFSVRVQSVITLINIPVFVAAYFLSQKLADIRPLLLIILVYGLANIFVLFKNKKTLVVGKPTWFHMLLYITIPIAIALIANKYIPKYNILLLCLFCIVWLCDVGAYFAGKGFGKNKLFPVVSPNKTWEGFIGGMVAGIITAVAIFKVTELYTMNFWIVLGLIVCLTSVIGDLIESSFKRHYKIKDSSNIIPGHGGFLDRLDSFIFALPFYTFFILIFG